SSAAKRTARSRAETDGEGDTRVDQEASRAVGRGHDGLQERARGSGRRPREGLHDPTREGHRQSREARRSLHRPGRGRVVPAQNRRRLPAASRGAGGGQLRDGLRRQGRRFPEAGARACAARRRGRPAMGGARGHSRRDPGRGAQPLSAQGRAGREAGAGHPQDRRRAGREVHPGERAAGAAVLPRPQAPGEGPDRGEHLEAPGEHHGQTLLALQRPRGLTSRSTMVDRSPKYNRVLLKLSGEALGGQRDYGIDLEVVRTIAAQITTDTTAALRAVEIEADVILKATPVDGVYTADPKRDPKAVMLPRLDYLEVLNRGIEVMDNTALTLCMDNDVPIVVFNLLTPGNIERVVLGEEIGTLVGAAT